jgi:hypothetical protein
MDHLGEIVGSTACETRWPKILESFERYLNSLLEANSDAKGGTGLVYEERRLPGCYTVGLF